jgi:hypothetical protein
MLKIILMLILLSTTVQAATTQKAVLVDAGQTGSVQYLGTSSNPMHVSFSGSIDLTPNVGIGSTSPGQALDVNGTIRSIDLVHKDNTKRRIDIKDSPYFAVSGGVVDNTAIIQTAVTANPGACIYFPTGVYLINAGTLKATVSTATCFIGDGQGVSVLTDNANNAIIQFDSTNGNISHIVVKDLSFLNTNGGTNTSSMGIELEGSAHGFIQPSFHDNVFSGMQYGIYQGTGNTLFQAHFMANFFDDTSQVTQYGIYLIGGGIMSIVGNHFVHMGLFGLYEAATSFGDQTVTGNNFDGNNGGTDGQGIEMNGTGSVYAANIVISSNKFDTYSPGYAITLIQMGSIKVFGNAYSGATNAISYTGSNSSYIFDCANFGLCVAGNVGIGTFLPVNLLDVGGGVNIGAGAAGIYTAPSNGLRVQGNIGIGTSLALAPIEIDSGDHINFIEGRGAVGLNQTSGNAALGGGGGKGAELDYNGTNGVWPEGSIGLSLTSGGNVGIGTLSASAGALAIGTDTASVAVATILCNCSTGGGVTIGKCTGTITGDLCTTCTCQTK